MKQRGNVLQGEPAFVYPTQIDSRKQLSELGAVIITSVGEENVYLTTAEGNKTYFFKFAELS